MNTRDIEDLKKVSEQANNYANEILSAAKDWIPAEQYNSFKEREFSSGDWIVVVNPDGYYSFSSAGLNIDYYYKTRYCAIYTVEYKLNQHFNYDTQSWEDHLVQDPRRENGLHDLMANNAKGTADMGVDWQEVLRTLKTTIFSSRSGNMNSRKPVKSSPRQSLMPRSKGDGRIWSDSLDEYVWEKVRYKDGDTYHWDDVNCLYWNDNGDESDYLMITTDEGLPRNCTPIKNSRSIKSVINPLKENEETKEMERLRKRLLEDFSPATVDKILLYVSWGDSVDRAIQEVIGSSRKPVKSDWERTDMASGPIWDNGKYRIIEKSRDGTHDDITNYYILRDKENLSKDDVHFYTLEDAMKSAEHTMSLESSRKITSARRGEVDSIAADELALCTENDGNLYRQMTLPVIDNLKKKMAKGVYDEQLALKAWLNVVTAEARKYVREFGSPGDTIDRMFNLATREEAAKEVARYYEDHLNQ